MLQFGCLSPNCPSTPPCAGATHSGLRVAVDLAQVEKELANSSFELRIETLDDAPRLYVCTLGQACTPSSIDAGTALPGLYEEEAIGKTVDLRFLDATTLVVDLIRSQRSRRTWGPEKSVLQISSGPFVQSIDLVPKYSIFQENECADCRIASERWAPQSANQD